MIQAGAGLACVAIVVVALWIVSGFAGSHASPTSGYQQVQATVTKTAACQGADENDSVSFSLDGQTHLAKLDGCGYTKGQQVGIMVPADFDGSTIMPMSDAAPGDSSGLSHRVAFLLLIVATVVGGFGGYQLFRTRDQRPGGPPPARPMFRLPFGRKAGPARAPEPEPEPDRDYHSEIRPVSRNRNADPEATGVDWFEDSSAHMTPVPPPPDLPRRPNRR